MNRISIGLGIGMARGSSGAAVITGLALPGETLTSTRAGQWQINGLNIAGQTGNAIILPMSVWPADKISQLGSNVLVVGGIAYRWDRTGYELLNGAPPLSYARASLALNQASSGKLIQANNNVMRRDYDSLTNAALGLLLESQVVNKCANFNANPTDTSNVSRSGDSASTFAVVDYVSKLTDAGLSDVCTAGKVFKLDNSAGVTNAQAVVNGTAGITTAHTRSVYWTGTGSAILRASGSTAGSSVPLTDKFVRVSSTGTVSSGGLLVVEALPGAVVYFILNQMEEGGLSSPIVVAGAAATRQAESASTTEMSWFDTAKGTFLVEMGIYPGSVTDAARSIFTLGGSGANRIRMDLAGSLTISRPTAYVGDGTTLLQSNIATGGPAMIRELFALSYSTTSQSLLARNGNAGAFGTPNPYSGAAQTSMAFSSPSANAYIKNFRYFPKQFTQPELATATAP